MAALARSPAPRKRRRRGTEDPEDPISSESQQASQLLPSTDVESVDTSSPVRGPNMYGGLDLVGFADGACRGNPGRASWGAVLWHRTRGSPSSPLWEGRGLLDGPRRTNNEAEYTGAIMCAAEAIARGATSLHLSLDSELVVKQYSGAYAVNAPNLEPLHRRLRDVASHLHTLEICHVDRRENAHADMLANQALDEQQDNGAKPARPAVTFDQHRIDQPSPMPPEAYSHSSFPGTQYESDEQHEEEDEDCEGPQRNRLSHGKWRKLRDVTPEWAEREPKAIATVLGLVTHLEPPYETPRANGTGNALVAKLTLQDGSEQSKDKKEITFWVRTLLLLRACLLHG
jgi:ribonuclease HI